MRRISKGQITVLPLNIRNPEWRSINVATVERDVVEFRRQPSRSGVDQSGKFRKGDVSTAVMRTDAGSVGERADPEAVCVGL